MNSDQWSLAEDPGQRPLASGVQIGPYRIEARLGEGGMGTVYLAVDAKLNRRVAIKFLSDAVADAAARRRFQREAQMASSLNHPHIVTVYDVGEFEERQYIVTEFVDGGTLKDWAKSEKRTWRQCVELLTGVADGLAAAHAAGILHRDIKPANVLVAKNGYAKLADFGLAKLSEEKATSLVSGDTLTMADAETRPGVVVGTVAYMSPEQASGKPLDHRSDIFSFGVLLYEQLAGRRPFGGASELEVLKTVIHGTPDPISSDIPQPLRTTVEKALEKDPAERYQTMRDVVVDLRRAVRKPAEAAPPAVAKPARGWLPWTVTATVAIVAIAVGLWLALRPAVPENPLANATFTKLTDFPGDETGAALSPDGKFVVFVSDRDGHRDALVGQVGTNSFQNLTKGAFTSGSRGRTVGFNSDGTQIWTGGPPPATNRLALIPLVGGAPRPLLDEKAGTVDWSHDGKRLVYMRNPPGDPVYVSDADGSNPRQIFVDQEGLHNHQPTWSPDGRWIYFIHGQVVNCQFDMWRIPPTGGTPEPLTNQKGCMGSPTPIDAHTVLYISEDNSGGPWLWALDPESKTTRRISSGVERYSSIAASADGRRLVAAISNPVANLWSVPIRDRLADAGEIKPFGLPTSRAWAPRYSQDGLFYLSSLDGGDGLWRWKDGQVAEIWKGSESAISEAPAISPDGRQVAIVLTRSGKRNIRVIQADGSQARGFIDNLDVRGTPAWSPDGKWLVAGGNDGKSDGLFKIPVDGGAPVKLASGLAFNPVWSKNRPLIVYAGPNVAAEQDLFGVNPDDGGKVDLPPMRTFGEGAMTRFMPDGNSLIYFGRSGADFDFILVDLKTNSRHSLAHLDATLTVHSFDITPDGKQIVFDRVRQNSDVYLIDLKR